MRFHHHQFTEDFMKRLFTLFLLAAALTLPGCNSSTGNDDNSSGGNGGGNNGGSTISSGAYLPCKIGNTWTFDSTGGEFGSSIRTDTISGSTVINGKTYWTLVSSWGGSDTDTSYFRVENNNMYSFFDTSIFNDLNGETAKTAKVARALKAAADLGPEVIVAKFGVAAGTTWNIYDLTLSGGEKLSVKGKYAGLISVTTTAGAFANCAEFETEITYTGTSFSMHAVSFQWYAPGVGPVKTATTVDVTAGGQTMTYPGSDILKSYSVK
jgi:predicted small secreted protein